MVIGSLSTRLSESAKMSLSGQWASFSADAAPELEVLEMMKTERYCEVLRNNVLPSMRQSNL